MNISSVNIDLTNECNKKCWICHKTKYGNNNPVEHIDFNLLKRISKELPKEIVIYFHYYGEPLLYPKLGEGISFFNNQITNIVTNGKLIIDKYEEIVGNLDTLCISIFEKDPEQKEQFDIIKKFIERKKEKKPLTILKIIGNVNPEEYNQFNKYALITRRTLFQKRIKNIRLPSLMPEYGICSDFLYKPLINRNGDLSICCRFDPNKLGVIGNLNDNSLQEIWNSKKRKKWLEYHVTGHREKISLCKDCNFWGITS